MGVLASSFNTVKMNFCFRSYFLDISRELCYLTARSSLDDYHVNHHCCCKSCCNQLIVEKPDIMVFRRYFLFTCTNVHIVLFEFKIMAKLIIKPVNPFQKSRFFIFVNTLSNANS